MIAAATCRCWWSGAERLSGWLIADARDVIALTGGTRNLASEQAVLSRASPGICRRSEFDGLRINNKVPANDSHRMSDLVLALSKVE